MFKIIQVGLGLMGNYWMEAVRTTEGVEYAALVEINAELAAERMTQYGLEDVPLFTSIEEAIAQVPAEGILNITPPAIHRTVSLAALEAGIPVLSEKPLADTLAAAQDIVRKSDETGVLLMIAQDFRYKVHIQRLKQILDSGMLGHVGALRVHFHRDSRLPGYHQTLTYPLLIDMSIHHFDLMRYLLNSEPASIFCRSSNPRWSTLPGPASANILLTFENGVEVAYCGSWAASGGETTFTGDWRFDCEDGVVMLRDDTVLVQKRGGAFAAYEPLAMPRARQAYLVHEFVEAVTTGKTPATICQDNIKSLSMTFDAIASSESGSVIRRTNGAV